MERTQEKVLNFPKSLLIKKKIDVFLVDWCFLCLIPYSVEKEIMYFGSFMVIPRADISFYSFSCHNSS